MQLFYRHQFPNLYCPGLPNWLKPYMRKPIVRGSHALQKPITAPNTAIRHKLPVFWHRRVSLPALINYQQLYSRQAACCFGQRNRRVPWLSMTVLPTRAPAIQGSCRQSALCSLQGLARESRCPRRAPRYLLCPTPGPQGLCCTVDLPNAPRSTGPDVNY